MTFVEYELNLSEPSIPTFVTDGGYWINPDNKKLIGVGLEGSIPDDITTLTLAELQARQRAIHAITPMKTDITLADDMTDDEVNATIKAWVDKKS
jgi:hypothetical protein